MQIYKYADYISTKERRMRMTLRRILTCFIVVAYLVAIVPTGIFAVGDNVVFYASESFDNYATNETPGFSAIKGKNVYVTETEPGVDKALVMRTVTKEAGITYAFSKSVTQFALSFDLQVRGTVPDGYVSVKSSGNQEVKVLIVKPANISGTGSLCTYDERVIGGIGMNKDVHIDLIFDLANKRYDVYIDGMCKATDWYIKGTVPSAATSAVFSFTGNDEDTATEAYLDNLYVYSGTHIISRDNLPVSKYNVNVTERNEIEEGAVGKTVYINRNYDEGSGDYAGMTVYVSKNNKITVEEEANGNKYFNMNRIVSEDCLFDINTNGGSDKMMIEMDVSSDKPSNTSIYFRDTAGVNCYLMSLDSTGQLSYNDGTVLAKLKEGKWTNVGFALDFETKKLNVYIDKRAVLKNMGFPSSAVVDMSFFRVQMLSADESNFKLDNFKIYDGTEFRDLSEEEQVVIEQDSIMPDYSDVISKLSGKVALHTNGGTFFANGKKSKLENPAYIKNGRTLVPVRAVSEGFGLKVTWDADTKRVTIGNDIEMTIGHSTMKVGSKSVTLDVAPEIKNGSTYLPLRALAEQALDKNVFWDDHGIIVISDEPIEFNVVEALNASNYMLYDRPSAAEIKEKFDKTGKGVHPRVMIDKDRVEAIKANYNAGGIMKEWGDKVIFLADTYVKMAPVNQDKTNTSGTELLPIPQLIKKRVETLAMAYWLTGDQKYPDRVWAELKNATTFVDWVPEHYLNVSEFMTAFAIGYDWLYDCWTDDQRQTLETATLKKGLNSTHAGYYGEGLWWAKETINWNLVCNGGSICAAIAFMEVYPDICADIISNALKGMEFALASYYPDGAWFEGVAYWEFATEFYIRACSSLDVTFGEDFNISKAQGLATTAEMPIYNNGYVASNNYHDAAEVFYHSPFLFWLADKYNTPTVAKVRYADIKNYDIYPTTLDMIYCNLEQINTEEIYPLDKYMRNSEMVSMRSSWDDIAGTYLSYHGGYAHENHGHVDSGSFVLDMLGERIVSDLGAEAYEHPAYKNSETRYTMYRARPEGHNMIVINPDKTEGVSLSSFAEVEKTVGKPRGAYSVLNLTEAYGTYVTSYRRGYKLEDDRRSAVIRDELTLKKASTAYWFMHTKADIEIVDETTAILTRNQKRFLVRVATNAPKFAMSEMEAVPLPTSPVVENQADNTAQGFKKLAINFEASGDVYIEVKIIPYDDPASSLPLTNLPIDEWTIPDGEASELPKAKMIYANGVVVNGFKASQQSYIENIPYGENVPEIKAEVPDDAYCEITNPADSKGTTIVKVISKNNPNLYTYYYISYREILVTVGNITGINRHPVRNIVASDNPQEANMDVNILDGNLNTRWSADGSGQWVMLDLGESKTIDGFGIATYNGATRTLSYSVDVSDDGLNWENVYIGVTSLTNDIETVDIEQKKARFVKLTGYGNSSNTWNSITEFATFSKQ